MGKAQDQILAISQANAFAPPVPGPGTTGGFDFKAQDVSGRTLQNLAQAIGAMMYNANQDSMLSGVFSTFRANVPQLFLEVDREKAETLGIPLVVIHPAPRRAVTT